MTVLNAREIFNTPRQAIWEFPKQSFKVVFEDKEIVSLSRSQLIFSRYCWDLFQLFPNTPIAGHCTVKQVLVGKTFSADTHKEFLEHLFRYICRYNHLEAYDQKEGLIRQIFLIIDAIQNEIVERAGAYVATNDATDFVQVIKDPFIMEIHKNLRPTPEGVDRAYKQIRQYVQGAPMNHRLANAIRNKSANENQANQLIGPRGFISGRDLTVYMQPVQNGFIRGMGSLYEILVESLTAAKALAANETNIKQSEYTSRRIQLEAMSVIGVHHGDCGSTEYMDILITAGLLDSLKGKYYLDQDNQLKCVEGDEDHLNDRVVKFRTGLGCRHHDNRRICTTCLGKLSDNFPANSNIGYMMVAFLMEKITQAILSTKHLTHSVKKSLIQLAGPAAKYLYANEEGDLFFHQDLDLTGLQLILPNNRLKKLVDVLNLRHTNINLNKIGDLEEIVIRNTNVKNAPTERLSVAYKDRNCIITKGLLIHMKNVKIETDSRTNFVIPLDNFDKTQPILNSPLKEANILNFVNQIAGIIEKKPNKITDPYEKLSLLWSLVMEKFKIPLSVLEVIIYATTTYNAPAGNYRLGRNSPYPHSEEALTLLARRDFAAFAAYERQMGPLINDPEVLFGDGPRQPHPIGLYFTPQNIASKT